MVHSIQRDININPECLCDLCVQKIFQRVVVSIVEPGLMGQIVVISLGSTGRGREPELLVWRLFVDYICALSSQLQSHDAALSIFQRRY
jgi:hypothetical protein